jgi:serine/threonine protein phosphatase PrpC
MAGSEDIACELGQAPTADDATRRLIELALAGGGRDNVTVLVVSYRFPAAGAQ